MKIGSLFQSIAVPSKKKLPSSINFQDSLNPPLDSSQSQFCAIEDGSVRLLAPAGSGKTYALLHRCKYLAERSEKIKPRFLVFTFTRAARDELRDRLKNHPSLRDIAPLVSITTLNSWGFKFVKGNTTNLRLITNHKDRYFCIQNVLQPVWQRYPPIKSLLEDNRRKSRAGQDLLQFMDFLKSMGFRHDRLPTIREFTLQLEYLNRCGMRNQMEGFFNHLEDMELIQGKNDQIRQVFENFLPFWQDACGKLFQSALISLEDQKYWARVELENQLQEGRYTTGAARCHHILVDEFQDINPLDLALLKVIAGVNKAKLTIVGDDDQAIYEWRGATPEFILDPEVHLGGDYQTCILAVNYRSPRNIVQLSQRLIVHNQRRVSKEVRAARTTDAQVEILRFSSVSKAIDSTLTLVRSLLRQGESNKVALISRKRSQIIPYQIVFAGQNIPFYAAEDLHVLLSEAFQEMKDILAMRGRASLPNMFNTDPIQDLLKLCDKIKRYPLAKKDREELSRYLYRIRPKSLIEATKALYEYQGGLKGTNDGGRMSASFAEAIIQFLTAKSVAESIQSISDHFEGLKKDYGKSLEDIFYTDPPFLYLAEFAERYGDDYASFYRDIEEAIATLARILPDDEQETEENKEPDWKLPLHLMTALRAKGKEFDTVIVLDANDGIWPSKLAKTDNDLEQERRLFYVAMTRARRHLYFIVNDSILGEVCNPSPYLAEMGLRIPPTITGD